MSPSLVRVCRAPVAGVATGVGEAGGVGVAGVAGAVGAAAGVAGGAALVAVAPGDALAGAAAWAVVGVGRSATLDDAEVAVTAVPPHAARSTARQSAAMPPMCRFIVCPSRAAFLLSAGDARRRCRLLPCHVAVSPARRSRSIPRPVEADRRRYYLRCPVR